MNKEEQNEIPFMEFRTEYDRLFNYHSRLGSAISTLRFFKEKCKEHDNYRFYSDLVEVKIGDKEVFRVPIEDVDEFADITLSFLIKRMDKLESEINTYKIQKVNDEGNSLPNKHITTDIIEGVLDYVQRMGIDNSDSGQIYELLFSKKSKQ